METRDYFMSSWALGIYSLMVRLHILVCFYELLIWTVQSFVWIDRVSPFMDLTTVLSWRHQVTHLCSEAKGNNPPSASETPNRVGALFQGYSGAMVENLVIRGWKAKYYLDINTTYRDRNLVWRAALHLLDIYPFCRCVYPRTSRGGI